ncbi:MAG: DUF2382 domain-containing protein [Candidatus Dasytiphilus stammeri]
MSYEKIVTLFDSLEHAKTANKNLLKSGFYNKDISIIHSKQLKAEKIIFPEHDIWQRLLGNSLTEKEAKIYAQAIDIGGVLLILRTHHENETTRAMEILNASQLEMDNDTTLSQNCRYLIDEYNHQNIFGKNSKEGSKRVRRFVTEKHVEGEKPLHEEHLAILRCTLNNKPQLYENLDGFETKINHTIEQPRINRTTHLVEEVCKEDTERVQKNHDTVRKQEIECDTHDK